MRSSLLLILSSFLLLVYVSVAWNGNHVAVLKRHHQQKWRLTNHADPPRQHCYSHSIIQPMKCTTWPSRPQNRIGLGVGAGQLEVQQLPPRKPNFLGRPSFLRSQSSLVALKEAEGDNNINNADDDNDLQEEPSSLLGRIKGYFVQDKKDDGLTFRQRLAKMGVATVLSYGMISNLSYAILISISWYAFAAKTKLSPLAPGQWKPFLGVYAGFWVFNNVIRPLRLGLSVAVAPSLDKLVLFFQNRFKISKPLAITFTVFVVNVVGTVTLMFGGIALASILARVPIFPPKGMA